jgi:hypothetical protein
MSITCFRGDTFKVDITATLDEEPYWFKKGDILKVGIKEKLSNSKCGLYKKIDIDKDIESVRVCFTDKEMKKVCEGEKILEAELTTAEGEVFTIYQDKIKIKGDVINE